MSISTRGRFAPSPTGPLHLGNARTALLSWLDARARGGRYAMRVEDLDGPRVRPGLEARILAELRWLGLDWDEGPDVGGPAAPYRQSERAARYREALDRLASAGLAYPCFCSRAEIALASQAPHGPSDEGPRYPGTCGRLGADEARARAETRRPAWRLRAPAAAVTFADGVHGPQRFDVAATVGDFVIMRADGVAAYQLAVAVDDLAMGIERVVRGADLLGSTARQLLLIESLGGRAPSYLHAPLVVGPDGARLAKRSRGVPVADHRASGRAPQELLGALAFLLGLRGDDAPCSASSLLAGYAPDRLPRGAVVLPGALLVLLATPGIVGS